MCVWHVRGESTLRRRRITRNNSYQQALCNRCPVQLEIHAQIIKWDATFLLTIGSFLLTVELSYLQLCLGAFLLTIGAFLPTIEAFFPTARKWV